MRSLALASLVALAATTASCTAVIGGPPDPNELLPCWIDDGFDPCPPGTRCVDDPALGSGRCVLMCVSGANEVCNGYDDDCDEVIDEPDATTLCPEGAYCLDGVCRRQCEVDGDMDGFTSCGTPADCDDARADINPTAREVCDGIDNDCNPATSDAMSGICAAGEVCTAPRGEPTPRCIAPDCTNFIECTAGTEICNPETGNCEPATTDCRDGTSPCDAGERCDVGSGVCVGLRDLGMTCSADVQCASERCAPYSALNLAPDVSGATGLCISACCRDSDCPADFRCWAPGSGVRACVPTARVPIAGDIEACSLGGSCPGAVCDARAVPAGASSVGMFICTAGTPTATDDVCQDSTNCGEGFCFRPRTLFGTYPDGWCGLPCRTSSDCDYAIDGVVGFFAGERACRNIPLTTGERLQVCVDVGDVGDGLNGAGCGGDGECRDSFCAGGRCSGICCSDGDCAAATEVCAPVNRGGWEMRCVPRLPTGPT